MQPQNAPHIGSCGFCGQGLLRIVRCNSCDEIAAVCDECELVWADPEAVAKDPQRSSSSAHPKCPHCEENPVEWTLLDPPAIEAAQMTRLCISPKTDGSDRA